MRNLIYLILAIFVASPLAAQVTAGTIVFNEKINVHAMLPERAKAYKDMIPEFRDQKKELIFNPELCKYYTPEQTEEEEVRSNAGGNVEMRFRGMRDNTEIIYDITKKEKQEFREFMNRPFLIVDENAGEAGKWKIGAGQKEILGFVCQEAIQYGEKDTLLAWFSPQIPVAAGPRGVGNLPGMILELDVNNGKIVVTATEVTPGEVNSKEIAIKGKGKKVTKEEFDKIVEEKTEEMKEMYGGGGNVIIRRN